MVAKMMFKNIKKKMANKENGSEKIQNEMKTEKQEQIMLRELIEGRLQF